VSISYQINYISHDVNALRFMENTMELECAKNFDTLQIPLFTHNCDNGIKVSQNNQALDTWTLLQLSAIL